METLNIIKYHSNVSIPIFTLIRLFFLFIAAAHTMACGYIFIGKREVY